MSGKDEQISQLLREERKIDEASALTFDQILALSDRRSRPVIARLIPAAGLILLVAVAASLLVRHWTPSRPPADASLLYWESPTEVCLGAPGEGILRYVTAEDGGGQAQRGRQ